MKKVLIVLACLGGALFAGDFEKNLQEVTKNTFKEDLQIVSKDEFKSIKGLHIVVLKSANGNALPLYVAADGKSFLAVSNYFYFSEQSDNELLLKRVGEIEALNAKAEAGQKESADKQLGDVFNALPKEASVLLLSTAKTDNLLTIVTDPDCPYCRNELKSLKEHLKTTNVRLVFAPVHDETAYIKAALILEETKKFSSKDTDKIVAVFEKYYKNIELNDKQSKTDTSVVHNSAEKIFGSGIVRGVPYLHNGKLK